MRQRRHFASQTAACHLIVQSSFSRSHSIILAVVGKKDHWFNQQLILAADEVFIANPGGLRYHHTGILAAKVPLDGVNIIAPPTAYDGRHCRFRLEAGICDAGLQGKRSTTTVAQLAYFAKMGNRPGLRPVGEIHRPCRCRTTLAVHNRNPNAIIARIPKICRSTLPHRTTAAVDVGISAIRKSRSPQHTHQQQAAQEQAAQSFQ